MMKKLLSAVLAFAMLTALLTGCDLFTSGNDGQEGGGSTGAIKMTDSYTFNDPGDIQFEKRYVIYADENSTLVSSAADYGMKATYMIVYADADDGAAGLYSFMIVDSEENAQGVIDLYASQGQALVATEEDPCVLYAFSDGETLEANLILMQSLGAISEATVSTYVEWYASNIGATVE